MKIIHKEFDRRMLTKVLIKLTGHPLYFPESRVTFAPNLEQKFHFGTEIIAFCTKGSAKVGGTLKHAIDHGAISFGIIPASSRLDFWLCESCHGGCPGRFTGDPARRFVRRRVRFKFGATRRG
jgi:hypothetical protein